MNSGKIVADGWTDGTEIEGSIRGPGGPKNIRNTSILVLIAPNTIYKGQPCGIEPRKY